MRAMSPLCPHCQSSLPPCDPGVKAIVCPSCGSSIQLDPNATTGWLPEEAPKRLGKFVPGGYLFLVEWKLADILLENHSKHEHWRCNRCLQRRSSRLLCSPL
jgi:hypothetical protein